MSRRASRRTTVDIPSLPEFREMIRRGALVSVSTSGVKDSLATAILPSLIFPRELLLFVHAPLREVEWPGTIENIENTRPDTAPLILAPIVSDKTLLDRIEERDNFPSVSARWCTSDLSVGPSSTSCCAISKPIPASMAASSTP